MHNLQHVLQAIETGAFVPFDKQGRSILPHQVVTWSKTSSLTEEEGTFYASFEIACQAAIGASIITLGRVGWLTYVTAANGESSITLNSGGWFTDSISCDIRIN